VGETEVRVNRSEIYVHAFICLCVGICISIYNIERERGRGNPTLLFSQVSCCRACGWSSRMKIGRAVVGLRIYICNRVCIYVYIVK